MEKVRPPNNRRQPFDQEVLFAASQVTDGRVER